MFDIGFWELVILFGLGLIVLGPERLPKVAMQVGNWAGQARRMARTLSNQMRTELDVDVNQAFKPAYTPKKPATYQRPGVDDLKPGAADTAAAASATDSSETSPEPAATPAEPPAKND